MALPLIAIAAAALAAGTALQISAARSRDKASAAALRSYGDKARALSAEAQALFEKRLGEQNVTHQQAQIDAGAEKKVARVEGITEQLAPTYDPLLPGAERAPTVVREENARQLAEGMARARAKLQALSTLEGFSGRTFDRGVELARDRSIFENQAIFDRGDRQTLEFEQLAAQQKGGNRALLGDILSTVGAMMLLGGAGGAVKGAAGKTMAAGSNAGYGVNPALGFV